MVINSEVYIAGVGMITPVGASAKMTSAAIQAGINGYRETDFLDSSYQPVKMALVPDDALALDLEHQPIESRAARDVRQLQLACMAVSEIAPLLSVLENDIPLFLAGSEPMFGLDAGLGLPFLRDFAGISGINLDLINSRCINKGRAGGLEALNCALRYLEANQQSYALVGGVDTFYDLDTLTYYLNEGRILTSATMDGFIPGEAAGFFLLKAGEPPEAFGPELTEPARLNFEPGAGREPGHLFSDEVYRGDGLASAFTQALNDAPPGGVTRIYSSMNGESYFSKELGVAMIRNQRHIHDECVTLHPADCLGDIGAAVTIVLSALAVLDAQRHPDTGIGLVYGSSDSEHRRAICIS